MSESKVTIPEAAVQAAVRHYNEQIGGSPSASWLREILEVAAPHIMREACDTGATATRPGIGG